MNRDLDNEVAERVMGGWPDGEWIPLFSSDVIAAFSVANRMVELGHVFIIKGDGLRSGDHSPRWTVLCGNHPRVDSDNVCEAICKAALQASTSV
jgi:hypothetical protein